MPGRLHMGSFQPEILGEIFLACIPLPWNCENLRLKAYFPWRLSHVCHHWRATALAFPKLWSFLDVEQTVKNEAGRSPALLLMETYLERSGQHPLTFRLSDDTIDQLHYQPFLECLSRHAARWQHVILDSPNHAALEYLAQREPSEYPSLCGLVCSYCDFEVDKIKAGPILHPIPWSQLKRYHEYECSWYPNCDRQWVILAQLTNMVDLRISFDGSTRRHPAIKMPHLRFASIAVNSKADELQKVINCFDFPNIQGLNLALTLSRNSSPDMLRSVPVQLKGLKILRLCPALGVAVSDAALLGILTEIPTLTDLAVELARIDAACLFTLLTPTSSNTILVPELRALRIKGADPVNETLDALLAMLRQRFEGAKVTRLERFALLIQPRPGVFGMIQQPSATPTTMPAVDSLESLSLQEWWDIRVAESSPFSDFWREEMDDEFL